MSVLLAAEDADDEHHAAAGLLEAGDALATLELAAYETLNVAVRRWHDVQASTRLCERVFAIARYGQLVRVDRELTDEATALAAKYGISVYDAGYVAAARRLGTPLASCDERVLVSRGLALHPAALIP